MIENKMKRLNDVLVSVMIPAYNHERYIAECVRSVMAQNCPRMELLICDDGSRDGTWDEIVRLAEEAKQSGKFERVEIFRQENRGITASINRLYTVARGDFVAVIASDDAYLPDALSRMAQAMLENETVGVVLGQNEIMDSDGRRCWWDAERNVCHDERKARYGTFNEFLVATTGVREDSPEYGSYAAMVKSNHIANGVLYRRETVMKILPYPDEKVLEDWWFNLQMAKLARFKTIPHATFRYRWHSANTIKQSRKMWEYAKRTMEIERDVVRRLGDPRWIEAMRHKDDGEHVVRSFGCVQLLVSVGDGCKRRILKIGKWRIVYRRKRLPQIV